jgi:hypothetical protein
MANTDQLAQLRALLPLADDEAGAFLALSEPERAEVVATLVDAGKIPHDTIGDIVRGLQLAGVILGAIVGAVTPGAAAVNAVLGAVAAGRAAAK